MNKNEYLDAALSDSTTRLILSPVELRASDSLLATGKAIDSIEKRLTQLEQTIASGQKELLMQRGKAEALASLLWAEEEFRRAKRSHPNGEAKTPSAEPSSVESVKA